jgi:hypothetical protein
MTILVVALISGSAFAQAQFLIDDHNPQALTLLTVPPDNCQTVTITLDPGGEINTSLITAGCGIGYDESQVTITNVVVADADAGGPWDPGFTGDHGDAAGPGTYYITMGNFATVPIDQGPIPICEVEFCSQGLGESQIFIVPGYGFSDIAGDTTIWDPDVDNGIINLTVDEDTDCDGIRDGIDNCPDTPNGPELGTCTEGMVEETCTSHDDCDPNGVCSMNQEDMDLDGTGDVCDDVQMCKGDFDFDSDVDGTDAALFKFHFGRSTFTDPCPPDGPAPASKTGQSTSYTTGDDGEHQSGVPFPEPRFVDNEDGTVRDNLTGLIWLKNANCIATNYPAFDNDDTSGDGRVTWQHALDFVAGINDGTYSNCGAGNSDWRLPNFNELFSLQDHGNYNPALPSGHPFLNIHSHYYWSSNTRPFNADNAIFVNMAFVYSYSANKAISNYYVWPVRGGH